MGQPAIEIRITSVVVTGSSGHPGGIHLRAEWTKGLRNLEQTSGDNRRKDKVGSPTLVAQGFFLALFVVAPALP